MRSSLNILWAAVAGVALGSVYFVSLWWTVQRLATVRQPAALLLASYVARIAVVVVGVLLIGSGEWTRLAACLVGFLLARLLLCRLLRPPSEQRKGEGASKV